MPEDLMVQFCAPTLAGLKTGSLFTASYESEEQLKSDLERMNELFRQKGLRAIALRYRGGKALLYIYRPRRLQRDLERADSREILARFGYAGMEQAHIRQNLCLAHLTERICASGDFPHEIGLFLGYPPEDVRGFIDEGSRACKASGYWKVYGDVRQAEELFTKYRKCTGLYLKCWRNGTPMEKLAVCVR
ncbi:MAG: DUF3793 family protein [Mogibacterium sp.]|nr:DUF3793 family protein [Mogibacterium sp.]